MAAVIRSSIVVRNPRNLERLRLAPKTEGYSLQKNRQRQHFYYTVDLVKTHANTAAYITHVKEGRILSATTYEPAISSRLYSTTDVSAFENIGRILGKRCLQAGIHFIQRPEAVAAEDRSEKISAFYRALHESGLILEEPTVIKPLYHWEFPPPDKDGLPLEEELIEDKTIEAQSKPAKSKSKKGKAAQIDPAESN